MPPIFFQAIILDRVRVYFKCWLLDINFISWIILIWYDALACKFGVLKYWLPYVYRRKVENFYRFVAF